MNRRKIVLTLIATLLIGFMLGFFTSGRLVNKRIHHKRLMMTQPDAEKEMLITSLKLSDEQVVQISPTLDSALAVQIKMREQDHQDMRKSRRAMMDEVKALLTVEQLKLFRDLELRRQKNGPRGPGPE